MFQETWTDGKSVMIRRVFGGIEEHRFKSAAEAKSRAAVIIEGLSWVATPFKDCSDVKGPSGCVDCAMLLVRVHVDTGILEPFDPRPYPPTWLLHRDDELFLGWIRDKLGGREVKAPRVGDCLVYKFGRCFSHGAILINRDEVVHAFVKSRMVQISRRDEQELAWIADGMPRPVKYFEVPR